MRLIDADEFIEYINRTPLSENAKGTIYNLIANQPTAYDVEKVVEKLERCQLSNKGEYKHLNIPIVKAVDIVKEGGVK